MSRKSALRLDDATRERATRVPPKNRRRRSVDGQLVGEVIAIAFDRCEALDAACDSAPDALCTGCGTARCNHHGIGRLDERRCSSCTAELLVLATAAFDDVLDTRMRLAAVTPF